MNLADSQLVAGLGLHADAYAYGRVLGARAEPQLQPNLDFLFLVREWVWILLVLVWGLVWILCVLVWGLVTENEDPHPEERCSLRQTSRVGTSQSKSGTSDKF